MIKGEQYNIKQTNPKKKKHNTSPCISTHGLAHTSIHPYIYTSIYLYIYTYRSLRAHAHTQCVSNKGDYTRDGVWFSSGRSPVPCSCRGKGRRPKYYGWQEPYLSIIYRPGVSGTAPSLHWKFVQHGTRSSTQPYRPPTLSDFLLRSLTCKQFCYVYINTHAIYKHIPTQYTFCVYMYKSVTLQSTPLLCLCVCE